MDLSQMGLVLAPTSFVHSGNRYGDIYRFASSGLWMLGWRLRKVDCAEGSLASGIAVVWPSL
jgi:hypothetical protein